MRGLALIASVFVLTFPSWQDEDEEELEGLVLVGEEEAHRPSAARIARVMELREPGEEHELLARLAGSWKAETKIWPTPDATDPLVMQGTLEAQMVLGGRFLRIEASGGEGAFATERMAMLGFDRRWEEYTAIEFDSWGTYSVRARGKYDPETRTINLLGEDRDPILEVTQKYNFVYELVDDDTIVNSVVFLGRTHGNARPFKLVETTLRRR